VRAERLSPARAAARHAAGLAMRPECVPCALSVMLSAVRHVSADDWLASKVLAAVMADMPPVDPERTPAEYSYEILKKALRAAGSNDPFVAERRAQNDAARNLLPLAEKALAGSKDRLETAVRLALAGNCFDPILPDFDPEGSLERWLKERPARFEYADFRQAARAANSVLYILDNCGEAVFDKLLVRELAAPGREIFVAVRHAPVLNDATRAEAEELTFSELGRIVDPGRGMLGVVLPRSSAEFRKLFGSVDMVVSKGQANCETLAAAERDIFFLLQVKCRVVADHLKLKCGDACLAYRRVGA
jgi:damage-control phosphatase, subfamily I